MPGSYLRLHLTLTLALLGLGWAGTGLAQATDFGHFAVERLRLASTRDGVIGVEPGTVLPHLAWEVGGWFGYARDPLVIVRLSDSHQIGTLVEHRAGGALIGSLGLWNRGAVSLELPFVVSQTHAPGPVSSAVSSLRAAGLGAVRVVPRYGLLRADDHGLDLAAQVGVRLPTGDGGNYISSPGVELEPELDASRKLGKWRLAANAGAVLREKHQVLNIEVGNEIDAQLGAARSLGLGRGFPSELQASVSGFAAMGRPLAKMVESAFEARGAAAWDLPGGLRILGGLGVGLSDGWGIPTWRVFIAGQFAPMERAPDASPPVLTPEPAPAEPVEPPAAVEEEQAAPAELVSLPPPPPPDRDGDGLADEADECPDVAGAVEDHGCPPATIKLAGDKLEFEGSVHFDSDQDLIQSRSFELLDGIAAFIAAHPLLGRVRVEGHTDAKGSRAHNLELSRRRADAVACYLAGKGVAGSRLTSEGYGPDRPVVDNETAEGRARNRRVEFRVEQPPAAQQ